LTLEEMREVVKQCEFDPHSTYHFHVREAHGGIMLSAVYMDPDTFSRKPTLQYTRQWRLSPEMTQSEIVQTCFKLCITSMEHRAREAFKWRGRRVFGPHFDVEALWGICDQTDYREDK
jgi:hypothetical protein